MSGALVPGADGTERANSGLFAQVSFHIIEKDLSQPEIDSLRNDLLLHGAIEHINRPPSNLKFDLEGLSHIIAATIDFEGYEQVEECFVNVVRPDWVHHALTKGKLPNPRQYSADPRMIFSGLVVCVAADIPEGEKDALVGGLLAMGGLYAGQMSRQVTHVVALSMDPLECRLVKEKKLACRVVLPHWFDDCLRLSRRIDEEPYTLPNPALLDGQSYELKQVERPDMVTAMYLRPGHLPQVADAGESRVEDLDIFAGKSILLHTDLDISPHLRATIEDLIVIGGGRIVSKVHDADVVVCQWRDSMNYRIASQKGKIVGNLSWLYHIISHNKWTSPLKRLLHYPFARGGIPGFDHFKLSLSNYSGEARIYLENLAKAAGSTFTKAFKTENTHLVTAHERSEKVDAAKEWGISIINHLWLEDCYALWEVQPVDRDRYTYMPPKTNMGEVVGQTPVNKAALEKHFYAKAPESPKFRAPLEDSEDDGDLEQPLDEIFSTPQEKEDSPNEEPQEKSSVMKSIDHNAGSGESNPDPETPATKAKKPGRPKGARIPRTPANVPQADGKENETPRAAGSRSAKSKATEMLHSLAPDIELFQKEMKRAGGVIHGGRRSKEDLVSERPPSRKRSATEDDGPSADESDNEEPDRKKSRGAPVMRLMITGWGSGKAAQAKAALRDVGILLTEDYNRCTHLAAAKIVRTKKFMCALAAAPTIVSISFVEECLKKKQLVDASKHLLKDSAGELSYGIKLKKSIDRARDNKRKLLKDVYVYVTPDVHGGFETFQSIVKANGGNALLFQGRPGAIPTRRAPDSDDEDDGDDEDEEIFRTVFLARGDTPGDEKLGSKFKQMAEKSHWKCKVVRSAWLLDSALAQEIRSTGDYET